MCYREPRHVHSLQFAMGLADTLDGAALFSTFRVSTPQGSSLPLLADMLLAPHAGCSREDSEARYGVGLPDHRGTTLLQAPRTLYFFYCSPTPIAPSLTRGTLYRSGPEDIAVAPRGLCRQLASGDLCRLILATESVE